MTDFSKPPTPQPHLLPKLDEQQGPAPWISAQQTRSFVKNTLRVHRSRKKVARTRIWQVAAGLIAFLGISGVAAALLLRPARTPSSSARSGVVLPAAFPETLDDELTGPAEAPLVESALAEAAERPRQARSQAAADLLAQANGLRSRGHWSRAARAYEAVSTKNPRSPEGYAAMVAAGELYLEKLGEPRKAAVLFASALKRQPTGPLAEEARWGLVRAYRTLKRPASERAALRAFVAHHPTSAFAVQARARLNEL